VEKRLIHSKSLGRSLRARRRERSQVDVRILEAGRIDGDARLDNRSVRRRSRPLIDGHDASTRALGQMNAGTFATPRLPRTTIRSQAA